MSALTDHIWREHRMVIPFRCSCDCVASTHEGFVAHIATVTEAAVREHIAATLDDLARARHDDLKETKRRTRAETFAGASAMAYELAARIARGEQ